LKPSQSKNTSATNAAYSRSEEVRARHSRRSTPRAVHIQPQGGRSTAKARYNYTVRPVVIRGYSTGATAQRRVQSKVRKQVVIPLNTPGAEIRLPALASIRPSWRLLSSLMAIGLVFILYSFYNNPAFKINQVKITGIERITAEEINTTLALSDTPIIEAVPAKLESNLRTTFPDLAKVQVTVSLPAKVVVNVIERKPVLSWEQDGKITWIDQDGIAFPPRGNGGKLVQVKADGAPPKPVSEEASATATATAAASQPAATAEAPTRFIDPGLVKALAELGAQAPDGVPIAYNPEYGLGWNDPHGWQVFFGSSTDDMEAKLVTYNGIVDYLIKKGITPKLVSVEFAHAPFYRLEP
jgi:cell division septal protein FtsQ